MSLDCRQCAHERNIPGIIDLTTEELKDLLSLLKAIEQDGFEPERSWYNLGDAERVERAAHEDNQ